MTKKVLSGVFYVSILLFACKSDGNKQKEKPEDVVKLLQEQLINAVAGDVVSIPAGNFEFNRSITLDGIEGITIQGAGRDKTILSFKGQVSGAEGLKISANGVVVKDLAIEDTKGDAIKIQDSKGVTLSNLKISWTGGPSPENGAYGLYPVSCQNVLIEGCQVSDASDAGIYVGQSIDVVVRNNTAFNNVAGIEIENCIRADVYGNEAYENTGGIFVFDLPELPQKNGHTVRLHDNIIRDNNYVNFAPEGNTVALVPSGTGVLIMSTREVEIFGNKILNHHTTSTSVVSYLLTQNPFEDSLYNPYSYGIYIHDNEYVQNSAMPDTSKDMGRLVAGLFGTEVPEIIYDGMMDPDMVNEDGRIADQARICIQNNGEIQFANINAPSGFKQVSTNLDQYNCELQALNPVEL